MMYPGEVTIVAALVEDPMPARSTRAMPMDVRRCRNRRREHGAVPVPPARALPIGLNNHDEYVWHCHILEHEEHDMMRPLVASS